MPEHAYAGALSAPPPENYERYFVPAIGKPLADDLLGIAALRAGERVIDVGCGTGVVARMAAQRVGPRGTVVGIDIMPGMLAVARAVTPPDLNIEWREGAAEALPVADASFDVALCQMTLQFVEDRSKALAEMHRVLVPGGRIVLDLPGPATPQFTALAESIGKHVFPDGKRFVERVFSLHLPATVEELLRNAGFQRVEVRSGTRDLALPPPRAFLWQYLSSTPLSVPMQETDRQSTKTFEAEVLRAWEPYAEDGGMMLHQPMVFARAMKSPARSTS